MNYTLHLWFRPTPFKEIDKLYEIYKSSSNHVVRQKCHIILLFYKNFSYREIKKALFLDRKKYIYDVLRYWYFNRFEVLSTDDLSIIKEHKFWGNINQYSKRIINKIVENCENLIKNILSIYRYLFALIFSIPLLLVGVRHITQTMPLISLKPCH